jgi:hypothetical protein
MDEKKIDFIQKTIIGIPRTKKTNKVLGKDEKVVPDKISLLGRRKDNKKFKVITKELDSIIGKTFKPIDD